MKVSNCCNVRPYRTMNGSTEEMEICPNCWEHCEYIDEEDDSEEWSNYEQWQMEKYGNILPSTKNEE